ncbi:PREDICTED: probable calcium-binding protein CML48 [Nicotiana attenuata]|uniref:Calcium-binding protein cml48 n=1 Tax=Nicotiana attenuata TaxID=49451 RepID=A0A1J6L5J4_NICAT|nr:PREDICTED: probable calcium-binding protein CML48 [Nicotiana attenuata]OIT26417.1 putative calcium-binding protein cml48 [Nicotiana attenuata]
MSSYGNRATYSPSAPPLSGPNEPPVAHPYHPPPSPSSGNYPNYPQSQQPQPQSSGYEYGPTSSSSSSYGYNYQQPTPNYATFPPGTDPQIIQSFQMVDRDQSGFVEEKELQQALSSGYQRFSLRTIRLLIFLFKNPSDQFPRIGPKEFAALWSCLGQWRAIFERFDRDRSGKIDATELRDALYSLGYMVPPSVLEVLISRYTDGSSRRPELCFDSFVECGMIVKGLTEKFKEKDTRYTGSAKLTYDEFMSMILPFIVSY